MMKNTNEKKISQNGIHIEKKIRDRVQSLRQDSRKGFTLVELCVVLVILGILIGVGVWSLMGWHKNSEFKRDNSYAQSLYTAAQNQLTQYSERGQLGRVQSVLTDADKVPLDNPDIDFYDANGDEISSNDIWKIGTDSKKPQGVLYFLQGTKGDYAKYQGWKQAGTALSSLDASDKKIMVLYDMLDPYVYDKTILSEGTVLVEFDPYEGLVYAVFYSKNVNEFVYGNAGSGQYDISNRTESDRRDSLVGYYGVDTLSKSSSVKLEKPIIQNVKLNNEESLNLTWQVKSSDKEAWKNLLYNIDLVDAATKKNVARIEFNTNATGGDALNGEKSLQNIGTNGTIYSMKATVTLLDGDTNSIAEEWYNFPVYVDASLNQVSLILDAVDYAADETTSLADRKKTASISRFLLAQGSTLVSGETLKLRQVENIYATVIGSGSNYTTTSIKQSNTENVYFAKDTVNEAGDKTAYNIENGRHLYNVRYREMELVGDRSTARSAGTSYEVMKSFSWQDMQPWLFNGEFKLYAATGAGTDPDFVDSFIPIRTLRADSVFETTTTTTTQTMDLSDLKLVRKELIKGKIQAANAIAASAGTAVRDFTTSDMGLFQESLGTIQNLTLTNVTVDGRLLNSDGSIAAYDPESTTQARPATGTFCAVNGGNLENLQVLSVTLTSSETSANKNSSSVCKTTTGSSVFGNKNVGGIAGTQKLTGATPEPMPYHQLINRANVTGNENVGGIIGSISLTAGQGASITQCENYGQVTAAETESKAIGGIIGRAEDTTADTAYLAISACNSSPTYENAAAEISAIANSVKQGENGALKGYYVGGIVGENIDGRLTSCSTLRENSKVAGYVIGNSYVGGIVGRNAGSAGNASLTGTKSRNQVNVIGRTYVGGIVGCNAEFITNENTHKLEPSRQQNLSNVVSGWINEGVIVASENYVGGITGFNTGAINDCTSDVDQSSAVALFEITSEASSYAGGIAGYNNGVLNGNTAENGSAVTIVSMVNGYNFVGGVAGYNDVDGTVRRYALIGGQITGGVASGSSDSNGEIKNGGNFVGGFFGLNANRAMFDGNNLMASNPNKVSGNYFVGGIIGGNLIPVTDTNPVLAQFKTDNFLGELNADHGAFAGGFVGLNVLLEGAQTDAQRTVVQNQIFQAARELAFGTNAAGSTANSSTEQEKTTDTYFTPIDITLGENSVEEKLVGLQPELDRVLKKYFTYLVNTDTTTGTTKNAAMEIYGDAADATTGSASSTTTRFGTLEALSFVGGVIGYQSAGSDLLIRDVANITPVKALAASATKEQGDADTAKYAYAGGIIGKISQNVTIQKCSNEETGQVNSPATYKGGLAELNEGNIIDCTAGSLGDNTMSRIGGLVGINLQTGRISNSRLNGTITGCDYVGGLAAENYGTIENAAFTDASISASGENAGGITGYAHAGSTIRWTLDSGAISSFGVSVTGTGTNVGAVAGTNEGSILVSQESTDPARILNQNKNEEISIEGQENVGGFVGVQVIPKADSGKSSTGGTAGTLSGLVNLAHVKAEQGLAGGIVAKIVSESDSADESGSSKSGTVAASDFVVQNCENYGKVESLAQADSGDHQKEDAMRSAAGGITAVNEFTIKNCRDFEEISAGSGTIGGIAAINKGVIEACQVGRQTDWNGNTSDYADLDSTIQNDYVTDYESDKLLTLIGSQNTGGIAGENREGAFIASSAVMNLFLRNLEENEGGALGGIVGTNAGTIKESTTGVAWAAGTGADNSLREEQHKEAMTTMTAVISSKSTDSSYRYTFRDTSSEENFDTDYANVVLVQSYSTNASLGGIAGINEKGGKILGTSNNADLGNTDRDLVDLYTPVLAELRFVESDMNYYGYMGGIAGLNQGQIERYEFNGLVHGTANNPVKSPEYNPNLDFEKSADLYGYGGIAGMNGSDSEALAASIKDCRLNVASVEGLGDANNRVNLGGIAGVNGQSALISGIVFGTEGDYLGISSDSGTTDSSKLFGYTYTDIDKISYTRYAMNRVYIDGAAGGGNGNIGGVAGYNSGKIRMVGRGEGSDGDSNGFHYARPGEAADSSGNPLEYYGKVNLETTELETETDTATYRKGLASIHDSSMLITTRTGLIGGIAGYNRRTGSLVNCATGSGWYVVATDTIQDFGSGGIIGYNISEQDIENCDNYAYVQKLAGNSVGGMTGRNETSTTSSWTFRNCRNYGEIQGSSRVAGGIGHWKYKGGTIYDFKNFGTIRTQNEAAGGVVAFVYEVRDEILNFNTCENHGSIIAAAGSASGILGTASSTLSGDTFNFQNCVNTGLMKAPTMAGIVYSDNNQATNFVQCRNYGYRDYSASSAFYGIHNINGSNVKTMEDCFSVVDPAQTTDPIAGATGSPSTFGYYFTAKPTDAADSETFYISKIQFATSDFQQNNGSIKNAFVEGTPIADTTGKNGNAYYTAGKAGTIDFYFSQTLDQPTVTPHLFRNGTEGRKFTYTLQYKTETGDWTNVDGAVSYTEPDASFKGWPINADGVSAIRLYNVKATTNKSVAVDFLDVECEGLTYQMGVDYFDITTSNNASVAEQSPKAGGGTSSAKSYHGTPLYVPGGQKGANAYYGASNTSFTKHIEHLGSGSEQIETDKTSKSLAELYLTDQSSARRVDSRFSYNLFVEIDKDLKFVQTDTSYGGLSLNIGTVTAQGGFYRVPWNNIGAEYYNVKYTYNDVIGGTADENWTKTINVFSCNADIPTIPAANCTAKSITVTVTAYPERGDVQPSASTTILCKELLPMPLIRLELANAGNNACYQIKLENAAEYTNLTMPVTTNTDGVETTTDTAIDPKNIQIVLTYGGRSRNFTVAEALAGLSLVESPGSGNANQRITAYAQAITGKTEAETYERSINMIRESAIPSKANYNTAAGSSAMGAPTISESASGIGFLGTTSDTMAYQIKIAVANSYVLYYKTELVAMDRVLGYAPVVMASSQQLLSTTSAAAKSVLLNGFPTDLLERNEDGSYRYRQFLIRSYPVMLTNNVVYQGHDVTADDGKDTWSDKELDSLYVTADGELVDEGTAGAKKLLTEIGSGNSAETVLQPGFTLNWQPDGSYSIYFNELLNSLETASETITGAAPAKANLRTRYPAVALDAANPEADTFDEASAWQSPASTATYMKNQVFYHWVNMKNYSKIQPTPYLCVNDPELTGADGAYDDQNEFNLTWDQNVPTYFGTDTSTHYKVGASYQYTVTGTTADGKLVVIDSGTVTTAAPDSNKLTYDSSKWSYTNINVKLTRVGVSGSNSMMDTAPSTLAKDYKLKLRLSTISRPDPPKLVDQNNLDYVLTWPAITDQAQLKDLAYYQITVQTEDQTSDQAHTETFTTELEKDPQAGTITVDFGKFPEGAKIQISVKAIAKANAEGYTPLYRNGLDGVALTTTLPVRLDVPKMGTKGSGSGSYLTSDNDEQELTKTEDEFKDNALTLTMTADDPKVTSGNYEAAIAIYDTKEHAENGLATEEGGLLKVLGSKTEDEDAGTDGPLDFGRGLDQATLDLTNLDTEYAGKYIRVVMRAVADNSVSSLWTDDESLESKWDKTLVSYRVFRLPKVQIATPRLEYATEDIDCTSYTNGIANTDKVGVNQTKLTISGVEYADGYRITLVGKGQKDIEKDGFTYYKNAVSWITLKKDKTEGWQIWYKSTDTTETELKLNKGTGWSFDEPGTQLSAEKGTIQGLEDGAQRFILPDLVDYSINEDMVLRLTSYFDFVVDAETGIPSVSMILPEGTGAGEFTGTILSEDQVTVQALAPTSTEKTNEDYGDSKIAIWYRSGGDGDMSTEQQTDVLDSIPVTKEPLATNTDLIAVLCADQSLAFEIDGLKAETKYVAEVTISGIGDNADGSKKESTWLIEGNTCVDGAYFQTRFVFPAKPFLDYCDGIKTASVRIKSIISSPEKQGAASDWLAAGSVTLPKPDETLSLNVLMDTQEELQSYAVGSTSRAKSVSNTISGRQTEITWDNLFTESKADYYDIEVGRLDGTTTKLTLDLSSGMGSTLPKLEDYLKEDGKKLYQTDYAVVYNAAEAAWEEAASASDAASQTATSSNNTSLKKKLRSALSKKAVYSIQSDAILKVEKIWDVDGELLTGEEALAAIAELNTEQEDLADDDVREEPLYKLVGVRFVLTLPDIPDAQLEIDDDAEDSAAQAAAAAAFKQGYESGFADTGSVKITARSHYRKFFKPAEWSWSAESGSNLTEEIGETGAADIVPETTIAVETTAEETEPSVATPSIVKLETTQEQKEE